MGVQEIRDNRAALGAARDNLAEVSGQEYDAYVAEHGKPGFFSNDGPEESDAYLAANQGVIDAEGALPMWARW